MTIGIFVVSKYSFSRFKKSGYGKVALFVAIAVVLTLAITLHSSQLSRLFKLATTRQHQTFSELYFTDYAALPKNITAGKTYAVPFTTVNHETKSVTYNYLAQIVENGTVQSMESGSFRLSDTQSATNIVRYFAQKPGDQVVVVIKLVNQNETINYRVQS